MTKANNGAPGIDGVTFEAVEEAGLDDFLSKIAEELLSCTYLTLSNRRKEIPRVKAK